MRASLPARTLLASLCLLALASTAARVEARRKVHAPSTGLRAIAFAKVPPDFAFRTASGVAHLHDYIGAPVIVNFWATWCEPCEAELAAFAQLHEVFGNRAPLLAISAEAPGVARAYLAARHIDAVAIDDDEHRIADLYTVSAIPVTLVLGRDGTVAHVSVGQIDWPELRDAVSPLSAAAEGAGRVKPFENLTGGRFIAP